MGFIRTWVRRMSVNKHTTAISKSSGLGKNGIHMLTMRFFFTRSCNCAMIWIKKAQCTHLHLHKRVHARKTMQNTLHPYIHQFKRQALNSHRPFRLDKIFFCILSEIYWLLLTLLMMIHQNAITFVSWSECDITSCDHFKCEHLLLTVR